MPEFVLTTCFATYGLSKPCSEVLRGGFRLVWNSPNPPDGFRGVSDGLNLFEITRFILEKVLPSIWQAIVHIQRTTVEGFPEELSILMVLMNRARAPLDSWRLLLGVSQGSETVWFSEGFQRGLEVLEGSETVWFQRVSGVSETVWFQRGFKGVWNYVVLKEFQRNLKPYF